ncbi:MAG: hypothetical protein ACFB8W_13115 [Elainellaceae cyanobacterium]
MDAFAFNPPDWSKTATHAQGFCCPRCGEPPASAKSVWINRRSPVFGLDHRRKWQEFYHCECGTAWWGWSSDRPPSDLKPSDMPERSPDDFGLF